MRTRNSIAVAFMPFSRLISRSLSRVLGPPRSGETNLPSDCADTYRGGLASMKRLVAASVLYGFVFAAIALASGQSSQERTATPPSQRKTAAAEPSAQAAVPKLDEQLFRAIENADTAALAQLLDQGAHADAQNEQGYTPLMGASAMGRIEIVKLLLDKGANPALQDKTGRTALHYAAMAGNQDAAKQLIDKNAPVNAKDEDGFTPLMYSIASHNIDLVNLLLEKGADVNGKSNDGTTALALATGNHHADVADLLRAKGAQ